MPSIRTLAVGAAAFAVGAGMFSPQTPADRLDAAGLKSLLEGLGNEVKVLNSDAGKEKYEVPLKSENLNVPVAAELSASGNYIWLTVNLGPTSDKTKHEELLKQSGALQPTFFYITSKGNLMAGEAVDNRSVTPAVVKRCLDKLVADVDKSRPAWGG